MRRWRDGVEAQFSTRIANAHVFGGFTIGQNYGDQDTGDLNNNAVTNANQTVGTALGRRRPS